MHVSGEPGAGKTEAVLYAAVQTAVGGGRVMVACPTGALVTTYRERLPPTCDKVTVDTIHAGFKVARDADLATYAPPSRLRGYDLIVIEEASQVDDAVFRLLTMAILELPQKPFVAIVGDFQQLQPVAGGGLLRDFVAGLPHIHLAQHEYARSQDPKLLQFLGHIRKHQPSREELYDFFEGRCLSRKLPDAVAEALQLGRPIAEGGLGVPLLWLTVTNAGAARVNAEVLSREHSVSAEGLEEHGYPGDKKAGGRRILARPGMVVRLTRNMDKDRGYVNGAIGTIRDVLLPHVFTVVLSHGTIVLVSPIHIDGQAYVPCSYGYAVTIRRAQGMSVRAAVLWFDHSYPADFGYAYVGASRACTAAGLYYAGRIRTSDWCPVGGDPDTMHTERGAESMSDPEGDESERSGDERDNVFQKFGAADSDGEDAAMQECRSEASSQDLSKLLVDGETSIFPAASDDEAEMAGDLFALHEEVGEVPMPDLFAFPRED